MKLASYFCFGNRKLQFLYKKQQKKENLCLANFVIGVSFPIKESL